MKRELTRRQRLKTITPPRLPFAICATSLDIDVNVQLMFRNLACFNGSDFFVVGSDRWVKEARGATQHLHNYYQVNHFSTFADFMEHNRKLKNYNLVAIEQCKDSINILDINKYPVKPCFIFGNETVGLTDEVLLNCELKLVLPNDGVMPSNNVGVCSGIVCYDYIRQLKNLNQVYEI